MIIAAVDLGKARTGIAVCDKTEFLASPHTVIFEKSPEKLFEKVKETVVNLKSEIESCIRWKHNRNNRLS